MASETQEKRDDKEEEETGSFDTVDIQDDGDVDLLQLAKEQRMNTEVRRAIFVTVMSSSDYKDAHVRLLKLRLKKAEEVEIPRVILHCAGCEDSYNPYYTALARKFCTDHKSRKTFQFALWDVFGKLGEKKDEGDASDDEEQAEGDMSMRRIVTLGKLYGTLIANGDLSITSLKTLNFPYLKPKTKTLVEVLLVTTILESQKGHREKRDEKALLNVFINVDSATEMITGLQYFLKKVISKSDIVASKQEKETVKWAYKVVMAMLQRLMATTTLEED
jgi:nucleolar MIF4G domain-containing protein 1